MPRPKLERPIFRVVRLRGRATLYIRWTENGRGKIASTGTSDPEQAEAERARFEADYFKPREGATVGELIDRWLEDRKHKPSYVKLKSFGKEAKRGFGHLLPSQILEVVPRYIQGMAKKATMARRALEVLTFATGIRTERPARAAPRERYMTAAEARAFLKACRPAHLRIFVRVALQTGARHRAILGLTWDRVDLERGVIDFRDPAREQTKKRRGVAPIGKALVLELEAWKPFTKTHVVEWERRPIQDIGWAFREAAREAKMPWVTPHVLKHTAISWLAEKGFTVDQIADYTSTSPQVVSRIYRKINPESLRDMAAALDDVFAPESQKPASSPVKPKKK